MGKQGCLFRDMMPRNMPMRLKINLKRNVEYICHLCKLSQVHMSKTRLGAENSQLDVNTDNFGLLTWSLSVFGSCSLLAPISKNMHCFYPKPIPLLWPIQCSSEVNITVPSFCQRNITLTK